MDSTYLAQLFGVYFIVIGLAVALRGKAIMPSIKELSMSRGLLLVLGIVEVAAGLAVVLAYPVFTWNVNGAISIVGYMMVIEGLIYLAAPAKFVQKFIRTFNRRSWYVAGGILSVIAGICLAGRGFGFF